MNSLLWAVADSHVVAKRNVIKIKRVPEVLMFVLISPIMFVLLFAYVFGSSIDIPGGSYREFLIGGIFAQTVIFGATFTGAGVADDMQKGIIDRFRALPMSRAAVLVGRTASDVIYNVLSLVIMALTGLFLAMAGGLTLAIVARRFETARVGVLNFFNVFHHGLYVLGGYRLIPGDECVRVCFML